MRNATHRHLQNSIRDGWFRQDLYYRVNEITLSVPPLRERQSEAGLLARAFSRQSNAAQKQAARSFSDEAIAAIEAHPWPGNVRELIHRVRRAAIMAEGDHIQPEDLELSPGAPVETSILSLRQGRDIADRQAVERALDHTRGNLTKAAQVLGISRPSLYSQMEKYGIKSTDQA